MFHEFANTTIDGREHDQQGLFVIGRQNFFKVLEFLRWWWWWWWWCDTFVVVLVATTAAAAAALISVWLIVLGGICRRGTDVQTGR